MLVVQDFQKDFYESDHTKINRFLFSPGCECQFVSILFCQLDWVLVDIYWLFGRFLFPSGRFAEDT